MDWRQYLQKRGIFDETIQRYRLAGVPYFEPQIKAERPAVRYPTIGLDPNGKTVTTYRIKFVDECKHINPQTNQEERLRKYAWDPRRGLYINYYNPGALLESIERMKGVLFILNGEPAIWALHAYNTKRGVDPSLAANAICWFSEIAVPQTLKDDLISWGVKSVYLPPDQDEAGYKMALKVHQQLSGSGINLRIAELPFDFGSKQDFNDLWIASDFDSSVVDETMANAPLLSLDTLKERSGSDEPDPERRGDRRARGSGTDGLNEEFRGNKSKDKSKNSDDDGIDFQKHYEEWIEEVIRALGSPDKRDGRTDKWTCPVHDQIVGRPDRHPSFWISYNGSTPRPRCNCGIHERDDAWDLVAAAKGVPTWEQVKKGLIEEAHQHRKNHQQQASNGKNANDPQRTPEAVVRERMKTAVHHGDDALRNVLTIIKGDVSTIGNPVVFPMRALHRFGGLCHFIPAGMRIGVAGGSGEAKTQLIETWIDFWCRMAIDVLIATPEWTPELLGMRRLQRYTGYAGNPHVTVEAVIADVLWQKEAKWGIPEEQREGSPLSDAQREAADKAYWQIEKFPGKPFYFFETSTDNPVLYVEDFLEMVEIAIMDGRKQGRRMDVVVWDYLQLAEIKEDPEDEHMISYVIGRMKNHGARFQYVGVDVSQATKAASRNARSGGTYTAMDARYVHSDKYNLFVTLNRQYEDIDDGTKRPTNFSKLFVDKNSLAKSQVSMTFEIDFEHLLWIDRNASVGGDADDQEPIKPLDMSLL